MDFSEFPTNAQAPLFGVELDRVYQQPANAPNRILMIGQMLTGTATAGTAYAVRSADEAAALFGRRSQLARSCKRLFQGYPTAVVKAVGLADPEGTVAVFVLTLNGTATEDGTLTYYLAGQRIKLAVTEGDSAEGLAGALVTAINEMPECPFLATWSDDEEVTLTARHEGVIGNLRLAANHRGIEAGEETPAGITAVHEQTVQGAGAPDVSTAFDALGEDDGFRYVFFPWTDAETIDLVQAAMETRWGPARGKRGHAFTGQVGSFGGLAEAGDDRTADSHVTMFGFEQTSASPGYELGAAALAQVAKVADDHAARPARGQRLAPGTDADDVLLGCKPASVFTWTERNTLLASGISPVVSRDWAMYIERVKTLYKTNPVTGLPDEKFRDFGTMNVLAEVIDRIHNAVAAAYPACIIVDDGVPVRAGISVVRPEDVRATVLSVSQQAQFEALVVGLDDFKAGLVVARDGENANRINFLAPLRIVAALYQVAGLARVAQVG